jgi:hypothetical protein
MRGELDYRRLGDEITELVATRLNCFDAMPNLNAAASYEDIAALFDGAIERYRNDPVFRAKVQSLAAEAMAAVRRHIEAVA